MVSKQSRVIFFGASAVSALTAQYVAELGFPVLVIDCEQEKLAVPAFQACERRLVDFDNLEAAALDVRETDMLCVITRGHTHDPQSFAFACKSPAFYKGMMGCAKKNAKVTTYALEHGCTQEQVDAAFAPIGLDMVAFDAQEIALSIAAQLVSEYNKRFPREKDKESLHAD